MRLILLGFAALVAACSAGAGSPAPTAVVTPQASVAALASPTTPSTTPAAATQQVAGAACGVERWSVKTLSDAGAASVNFNAVPSTVAALRALPAPAQLPAAGRIAPTELTVFSVTARLVEAKLEADRDIHLVIADPADPSATMIVEFANADACSGAVASAHRAEMQSARQAFVTAFGAPSSRFTRLTGTATISGVGFFDVPHGQSGVAPNAIELHPVLAFSVTTAAAPPPRPAATIAAPPPPPPAAGGMLRVYACEASDCNCSDFPTHAEAQRVFLKHGGSPANNWSRLDANHNGIACESLP